MSGADAVQRRMDEDLARAWSGLLSQPAGREIVFDLLSRCHVFHSSLSSDPVQMAAMEGERNIGLHILNDRVLARPQTFELMLTEHRERSETIERAIQEDEENQE